MDPVSNWVTWLTGGGIAVLLAAVLLERHRVVTYLQGMLDSCQGGKAACEERESQYRKEINELTRLLLKSAGVKRASGDEGKEV